MSETSPANAAATDAQPAGQAFSLDKLYVKDVSFEAPGAAGKLRKAGFERVFVLAGGIDGWQQAGLPLAKGR